MKELAITLGAIAVCLTLAACGGDDDDSTPETTTPASQVSGTTGTTGTTGIATDTGDETIEELDGNEMGDDDEGSSSGGINP